MTVSCLSIGPCIMLNWCRPTVYHTHVSEGAFYNTSRSNKMFSPHKGMQNRKTEPKSSYNAMAVHAHVWVGYP